MQNYDDKEGLFLILTGLGGSTEGYCDKYSIIAKYIEANYNYSVGIESTPLNVWERKEEYFNEVASRIIENRLRVYLMGVSAGANLALWYSACYQQVKRVLAINPVLNINLHLTKNGVCGFNGEKLTVVLGEKDPSAKWAGIIPQKSNVTTIIMPGIDHVFSGKLNEFIALPKQFLF